MNARAQSTRLGDLLVDMRLLEPAVLEAAQQEQRASGRRLPWILAERNFVDEERLTRAVAGRLGIDVISLSTLRVHDRVLGLVPAAVATGYGVLPVAVKRTNEAEVLYLVMADPLDAEALEEVQRHSGRQIRVLMATVSELDRAIDRQYSGFSTVANPSPPPLTPPPRSPVRLAGGGNESLDSAPFELPPERDPVAALPTADAAHESPAQPTTADLEPPDVGPSVESDPFATLVDDERSASSSAEEWDLAVRDWESTQPRPLPRPCPEPLRPSKMLDQPWGLADGLRELEVEESSVRTPRPEDAVDVPPPDAEVALAAEPNGVDLAGTLELPVALADKDHPFDHQPTLGEVRVGLDRTAIFPAIDMDGEVFEPPPPASEPPPQALAGSSDIPYSPEAVAARFGGPAPQAVLAPTWATERSEVPDITEVEEFEIVDDASVTEVDAADVSPVDGIEISDIEQEVPVIEPSSLVSLMDDGTVDVIHENADTAAEPIPIHLSSEGGLLPADPSSPGPETGRFDVLMTSDGAVRDTRPTRMAPEASVSDPGPGVAPPAAGSDFGSAPSSGEFPVASATVSELGSVPATGRFSVPPPAASDGGARVVSSRAVSEGRARSVSPRVVSEPGAGPALRRAVSNPVLASRPSMVASDESRREVETIVHRLMAGESLSSAERAQVGVAVARLLVNKGVLSTRELVDAILDIA